MTNQTLHILRNDIDKIDENIIKLLAERMRIVKKIGEEKKHQKIQPLDTTRWHIVLQHWRHKARDLNVSEDLAEKLYNLIHEYSVKLQKEKK